MEEKSKEENKTSLNVNFGREVDSALGDVIRSMLKRPADEVGNLFADGISILSDWMKHKRLINAKLGLDETRKILENNNIDLKEIIEPNPEEFHIIIDGMSVSSSDHIRSLWSGLLAGALSPSTRQSIDRPITSAIAALSPSDAKIIQFAAFVSHENRKIYLEAERIAGVEGKRSQTLEDRARIQKALDGMEDRISKLFESATKMANELGLLKIAIQDDWADNLLRLGIIYPKTSYPRSDPPPIVRRLEVTGDDILKLTGYLEMRLSEVEGIARDSPEPNFLFKTEFDKNNIVLGFEFTRFGERLCRACGIA